MKADTDENEAAALEDERKFERLPKPAELSSTSDLDRQKESHDEKLRDVGNELQPLMAERSRNSALLAESREAVRELKAQIDDKELILNPYQQEKRAIAQDRELQRKTREEQRLAERQAREEQFRSELGAKQKRRNDFQSQYGHLGVSNEDEIDEKLQSLEFSQQHESLTISEEKAVLRQIKQLQDSREAVREYSAWAAEDKAEREVRAQQAKKRKEDKERLSTQGAAPKPKPEREPGSDPEDSQKEEMDKLRHVINGLWEDYKLQLKIRDRHQEIEAGLKQKIEVLFEKRNTLRKERDEVWSKIQQRRDSIRAANRPFSENRSFSAKVRELVKQGQVQEASQLCAEQTSQLMSQYAKDAEFRSEYNRLWDIAVDYQRPAPTASDSHHHAAASVIAEALEAARRTVASKQAKAKEAESKQAEAKKAAEKAEPVPAPGPAAPFVASKPTSIPGMETPEKTKPKVKKEKKVPKLPAVEIPAVDETPFVPPIAASEKSAAAQSAEELKEQERAHNRAAALEAAQRKERRRITQEKKKQKAQQRAENPLQALKVEAAEEVSAPETPPPEETRGSSKPGTQPEALAAAVSEDNGKLRNRVKPAAAKAFKPGARSRPFPAKKSTVGTLKGYGRQLTAAAEENPVLAAVGGLAVLFVVLAPVLYSFS